MRTEAEVKEAIRYMEVVEANARKLGLDALGHWKLLDMLRWCVGDKTSKFERDFMDACRGIDLSKKAADN